MWSTIENFKESLSQITADVLDAAEELEPNGSDLSSDGSEAFSRHQRIHPSSTDLSQVPFLRSGNFLPPSKLILHAILVGLYKSWI